MDGWMDDRHETTSHNITFKDNLFDRCGCIQNRGDRGAIAVMCPNNQKPSGYLANNTFFTLPGCPAINPKYPGCDDNITQVGTEVYDYHTSGSEILVEMPQVSFNPPAPTDTATSGTFNVLAVTSTKGAVIRYTLDGSRPTASSNVMPAKGLEIPWPGPAVNVNVKGFKAGMKPSMTNGVLVETNYVLGRMAPNAGVLGPGEHFK